MEPKIAPLVNRSLTLFETLSDSLSSNQGECSTTRSHLARFRLWVGSLGAHRASGGRSLEYRLRDSSFVRNHIISLLQELVSSIGEGIELANTESDDKKTLDDADLDLELYFQSDDADEQSEITNILGDIGHIIDCLLRLSITIRNPARHDQFNSRVGVDIVSSYTQWDINHIREKFSRLDDKLVDRLGMAMSRRRQYIKYREDHSKKLAHGLLGEHGEGENATTIASSIPKKLKDEENNAIFTKMDALLDNMSEASGTSYANSIAATNELRVPSIPKEYIDGPFLCPICHTLIIINDRNSWKKHVFRDLQPYVCLFDNCSSPSQVYQRRKDWVAHMKQEHWVSWSCSFGCSKSFRSQESFEKHATTVHGQDFESIDLQAVLNLCRFPSDTNTVGTCPFCFDYEIKSDKSYQSHVGDHLERLALFVLPKTLFYDDSDVSDEDNDDDDDGDDDEQLQRQQQSSNISDGEQPVLESIESSDSFTSATEEGNNSTFKTTELGTKTEDFQTEYEDLYDESDASSEVALSSIRGFGNMRRPPSLQPGFPRLANRESFDSTVSTSTEEDMSSEYPELRPPAAQRLFAELQDFPSNDESSIIYSPGLRSLRSMTPASSDEDGDGDDNIDDNDSDEDGDGDDNIDDNDSDEDGDGDDNIDDDNIDDSDSDIEMRLMEDGEPGIHLQVSRGGGSWESEEPDEGNTESTHPLMDYNMQLELLEQANKKRLMMARRQEQSEMEGIPRDGQPSTPAGPSKQPSPDMSPMAAKSGASYNLKDQIMHIISRIGSLGFPSPNPDDGQSLETSNAPNAPNAMDFLGNHVEFHMAPHLDNEADEESIG
ncbi:hypothetical protein CFAM422_006400 [Trichoderma lentiforme]|uniref:C2H2-type domain-containing protein n=1 Tax=Trichoderma lentiforme TaxID=1567552 RepID=A0A9P4XG76_9HYPO|nr:hypothetical protein CFAM422_006400 [Trichoderma lentiforme]